MKATTPTAPPKKALPNKAPPKYAAAKDLQTIDDPFFDDHDVFGGPQDAGPAGQAQFVGGGLGGLPGSGPPISRSGSSSLRLGPGSSVQPSTVAPGETAITERFRADRIAYGKSRMTAREAQNAERARQRRLNVLIGAGLLGIAIIVLFTLAAFVFSGSPENDGNVTMSPTLSPEDANKTDDDDIEVGEEFHLKREMTPQDYGYENHEVIASTDTGAAAVQWNGEVERQSAVRNLETKAAFTFPATTSIGNGQLAITTGKRPEKGVASSIWDKTQNKSAYRLERKPSNTAPKLIDALKSTVSAGTCSVSCQMQVSILLNGFNPKYSPCENLYEHVCSNWHTTHSRLADERGSYSVDDSLLNKLRARVVHYLLTSDGVSNPSSRQVFQECTNGTLVTGDSVQKLIDYLNIDYSASSAEALAGAFVRASRVGVSPFFDVAIEKKETGFSLTLIPSRFKPNTYEHQGSRAESFHWIQSQRYQQNGTQVTPETDTVGSKAFFQALERQLCLVVIREHGSGANCFLTTDSVITPSWDYEWYKSRGLMKLAFHTASTFKPFLVAPATVHTESNDSFSISHSQTVNSSVRENLCVRLFERYDPGLVMDSVLAISGGKQFLRRGKATLASLKRILQQRLHGAPNISLKFASPPSLASRSPQYNRSSDRNGGHWPLNRTSLQSFLLTATWKRWNHGVREPHEEFSATPTFEPETSTVYVPLPVFDLTSSIENPWLWHLSNTARVGPRFLKPILQSLPSKRLKESDLLRCLRDQSPENRNTESKITSASLDAVEVASFAYSLEAFHSHTTGEAAAPGLNISTDALFLYYYVFNKCTALSSSNDRNNTLSARASRSEVDSVVMAFGSSLRPDCTAQPKMRSCLEGIMK